MWNPHLALPPPYLTKCYSVKYYIPQNNNTENFKGIFLLQNLSNFLWDAEDKLGNVCMYLSSASQRKLLALLEGSTQERSRIRKMSTKI